MQQTVVLAGATDQTVLVRADTITTGAPNESVTNATSGLQIRYKRGATGAVTTVSPASQTSTGAHADGGIVHLHGGVYRVDLPDAAFASGAPWVVITLAGVADTRFTVATVDLSDGDPRAAVATAAAVATIDTEVGNLQSDVTAIKDKTDDLTFTSAGLVDANVQRINDVTITGDGSSGDKFDVV
jgi:hypothetical protein